MCLCTADLSAVPSGGEDFRIAINSRYRTLPAKPGQGGLESSASAMHCRSMRLAVAQ
jgi:hypothetical protein